MAQLQNLKKTFVQKLRRLLGVHKIVEAAEEHLKLADTIRSISIENFKRDWLERDPKYKDPRHLIHHEYSVYSQNGEDGIIAEIFKRIGTTNQFFVEFGVHGVKNNTTYLLASGWNGVWLEGTLGGTGSARRKVLDALADGQLSVKQKFLTAENIASTFQECDVPDDFDFLSIDVDGNDFWLWQALSNFKPRLVQIEYNATFSASTDWVMKYNPNHIWNETSYYGASLKALERLGSRLGYNLVGCDFSGNNAFFVREDCLGNELFCTPFTAEHHYEPPRHFMAKHRGHPPGFGPSVSSSWTRT